MAYRTVSTFLILFSCQLTTMADTWRGITPLKSTMKDVQAKLGEPSEHSYFQVDEGRVRIFYGTGDSKATTCWGRAGTDVVTQISVTLDVSQKLENRKGFLFQRDSQHPQRGTFSNWKRGIQYDVWLDDFEADTVTYLPSKKDCDELMRPS